MTEGKYEDGQNHSLNNFKKWKTLFFVSRTGTLLTESNWMEPLHFDAARVTASQGDGYGVRLSVLQFFQ